MLALSAAQYKVQYNRDIRSTLGLGSQLRTSKMAENTGLDEEFKRIVSEMKPHARNLRQKSG